MEIKKIIWASDGSKESDEALNYAVFLAEKFGSEIIGVYVSMFPIYSMYLNSPQFESEKFYRLMNDAEKHHKARLKSIKSNLSSRGFSFKFKVSKGEPSKRIVEISRREKADLIVMGKRGLGLIDRILIGSTTLKVLRNSKIPVLAVKKSEGESAIEIKNTLVPLDISENIDSALKCATELATKLNSKISVVNVFWIDGHMYDIPPRLVDDLITQSKNELRNRVEKVQRGNDAIEIKMEVLHGFNPAITVADYSNVNEFDLIVVNTHGRKGIKKLFLGSFTEKIIQESNCPVLVIRP